MSKRKQAIEAHFHGARRLHDAGRLLEADQAYRQVLAAAPAHAESLHMLGVIAVQTGQPGPALAWFDRAIALRPSAALFHVNRAAALLRLRRLDEAEAACRAALRLEHNSAAAHQTLGHVLCDAGKAEEAIAAYRQAARHRPDLPDVDSHLGLALRQAGRLEEAAAALQQAVRRVPGDPAERSNLAGVLKELGRLGEAEACYREALRHRPDDAGLHFNLALLLLLDGRFAAGWDEYEWRFRAGVARLPPCEAPRWTGERLGERVLLIRAEQGLGDTIQFCRYAAMAAGCGQVFLEVQPPLRRLLADGLGGVVPVIAAGSPLPAFDLCSPLLSLPRLLGSPGPVAPYLTADPERVARWRSVLGGEGRRIGIAWQGNPASAAEFGRSIPVREFGPLAQMPGVRLISLQKQHGLDQLAAPPPGLRIETLGDNFDPGPDAFVDTAAVMRCLDLIVTSDTAVAHLAGALGCPVWVGLQHVPDWRWGMAGDRCRWYPTMRLFRQPARGDWTGVFARMAAQLAAAVPR